LSTKSAKRKNGSWTLKPPLKTPQKNNQKVFVRVLNLLEGKDFWPWSGGTRSTILEFAARAQIANISK